MTESAIIWTITIGIGGLIVFAYYYQFRKKRLSDLNRKTEASRLGADKAPTQHPHIDIYRCIGCGACVKACPEGKVLGVVNGKSTLINGLKCVGHGLCALACPVNAITIGLGDVSTRSDIPILSETKESTIPGLYIAGELGGLALIKNAILQGVQVIEAIVRKGINASKDQDIVDVLIVGAGPAGLSAAMAALKHNLSFTIIDQQGAGGTILQYPRKKLVMTQTVEIPLWGVLDKPEYMKEELLDIWNRITAHYALKIEVGEKLHYIQVSDRIFTVQTQNRQYLAQRVVLAMGRRGTPRKLNVKGEEQAKVMYQLLDADSYQSEHLLVVGGGDSAIEAVIALAAQPGNSVTISYRKEQFFRIKNRSEQAIDALINSGKVKAVFNSNVLEIHPKSVLIQTATESLEIPNDYTFIFAGGEPPFELLRKIGVRFGSEQKPLGD